MGEAALADCNVKSTIRLSSPEAVRPWSRASSVNANFVAVGSRQCTSASETMRVIVIQRQPPGYPACLRVSTIFLTKLSDDEKKSVRRQRTRAHKDAIPSSDIRPSRGGELCPRSQSRGHLPLLRPLLYAYTVLNARPGPHEEMCGR